MIKNLFRNLRDNFVYVFIPMGIVYLFLLIALFALFFAFFRSASAMLADIADLIHLSAENSSASVNEFLAYSFGQLNWDASPLAILRQILDTNWLQKTLTGFIESLNASSEGFEEQFTAIVNTFAGEVKTGVSLFGAFFSLGVLAASYATRFAVRRRSAKRSLRKFLIAHTVVPLVQWVLLVLTVGLLFVISYYTLLVAAVSLLLSSAISLVSSWVVHSEGKLKLRETVTLRNALSHLGSLAILLVLTVAIGVVLYLIHPLLALLLILPMILYFSAIADVNTDAYVCSLLREREAGMERAGFGQNKARNMNFLKEMPIAHRGLHGETRPENSLAAFEAAVKAGYAIETDVRFTKDRQLVVFHDDGLLRMTGDPRAVSECTLEELARLRLAGTDERIPTLADLLGCVQGRVPLLIEIKNMRGVKGKEIAKALADAMNGYGGEYAFQSFQPFYVGACKRTCPGVSCGLLAAASLTKAELGGSLFWRVKASIIRRLSLGKAVGADFVSYNFRDLPQRSVAKFKGVKLGWTVRSQADEATARKYTDNIIFEGYLPEK